MRNLFALTVLWLVGLSASAAEFYVSPNGDNRNAGTKDQPFATLERARVIDAAARPHLRQTDLRARGITDYGELGPAGSGGLTGWHHWRSSLMGRRLRDDSAVWDKVPDFKPIPFGKIGLEREKMSPVTSGRRPHRDDLAGMKKIH